MSTMNTPEMTPKDLFAQAHNALRLGDAWSAYRAATVLRHHFPDDAPIKALHGVALHEVGAHLGALTEMGEALSLTTKALEEGDEENAARPRIVEQMLGLKCRMARSLAELGQLSGAQRLVDEAVEYDPDRAETVATKARVLAMSGDAGAAVALLDEAVKRYVEELPLMVAKGEILSVMGDADAAALGEVAAKLGELSETPNLGAGLLMDLLRAQGGVLNAAGRFDDAWACFRRAAKLRRGAFDAASHAKQTNHLIAHWTRDAMEGLVRPEEPYGAGRVLVCGTPCSGGRELEAALALTTGMFSLGPAEMIGSLVSREFKVSRGVLRNVVPSASGIRGNQLSSFAQQYNAGCASIAKAPGVITFDSHPHNLDAVGLCACAMPGLTVVLCRRDPMDTALSLYANGVKGNHGYAGDLVDTASYVKDCDALMDHWRDTLTGSAMGVKVVELGYDEIVSDPQSAVAKVSEASGFGMAPMIDPGAMTKLLRPVLSSGDYASHTKRARPLFEGGEG